MADWFLVVYLIIAKLNQISMLVFSIIPNNESEKIPKAKQQIEEVGMKSAQKKGCTNANMVAKGLSATTVEDFELLYAYIAVFSLRKVRYANMAI